MADCTLSDRRVSQKIWLSVFTENMVRTGGLCTMRARDVGDSAGGGARRGNAAAEDA